MSRSSKLSIGDLKILSERQKAVDVLMNSQQYADVVLKGGKVINVITREIYEADVAISGQIILMVGDCSSLIGDNTRVHDMQDKYLSPGATVSP